MVNPLKSLRVFTRNLGPVEQAQVVASTAVIVSMVTIISAMLITRQSVRLMDFISILTVGTIGFTSVYFTLQYARQLDEQRRQLLALNTIAESVNRVGELHGILATALDKVTTLLNMNLAWIYLLEGKNLVLKCSKGTTLDFFSLSTNGSLSRWLHQPRVERERLTGRSGHIPPELKELGVQFWTSIPLRSKDTLAGALVVAGPGYQMISPKQAELLEAFGNQISVALHNAQLFERLKQSEQQYFDLFENSPDIYLSVNSHHLIVGCNKTGATILGHDKREIIGKKFETFFAEDRQTAVTELLSRTFSEGKEFKDVEEQMITRDTARIFVSLNSSLVFDDRGTTVNARVVARDITERKKMEAQILHAQKIDSIGNLAGGIAHDFNNILASILGSASIMRRRMPERGKFSKYVEIIEGAARRGSSLTRQLLTFARKTETFAKIVNVNSIILETLQLFQRSVSKEIVVKTHLTNEAVGVNGDDGQIQQALLNLFLNARDAMPGGGTLTITTSVTMVDAHTSRQFTSVRPGPFVGVTVTDTGVGIDKATQNRIFEPFFTTKDQGTGLGLSVVYGVVQNHGGIVNVESQVGQGTTFTLLFPRVAGRAQSSIRLRNQRMPRGTESILIIDDEISVCEIARDMLVDLGYTVLVEHDGRAGVDAYRIRRATIDLVILDLNMPLMGGKEALEQLRAMNPNVRVIILTGYSRGVVQTPELPDKVSGFLQKPFQVEDLATKVRDILDRRTAEPQAHSDTV